MTFPWRQPLGVAVAAVLAGLLAATIETFLGGSPLWGWVAGASGIAATALVAAAAGRIAWRTTLRICAGVALGTLALTAWLPGGTHEGVRLFGLSTARVLALAILCGIVLAAMSAWRAAAIPLAARIVLIALAAYGVLAFSIGVLDGTPFHELLTGDALWRALPWLLQGTFVGGAVLLPIAIVLALINLGRPPSARTAWNQVVAMLVSFAIVLAGLPQRELTPAVAEVAPPAARFDPATVPLTPPQDSTELDATLDALQALQRDAPRDGWDPDYIVETVGTEPQDLFNWVRDNTQWIAYHGALRGPVGVLNDRLGNSLDRALLLATLLEKAGHPVRLAHGEMNRDSARVLLSSLADARLLANYSVDERPFEVREDDAMEETGEPGPALQAHAIDQDTLFSQLNERIADQTGRILATIPRIDPDAARAALRNSAEEALRDHWWVQRQNGNSWLDMDLLSANLTPTATRASSELSELYHEITVRVITERWKNGALREKAAIEHTLRPADLIGKPIVVRLWPNEWRLDRDTPPGKRAQAMREAALAQHEWTASLLVGDERIAESVVHDDGKISEPPRGGPMSGIAGGLSRAFGDAGGAVDDVDAQPTSTLTAAWFEYEIRSPGAEPRTLRRVVFDSLGAQARATPPEQLALSDAQKIERSLALMMYTDVLPVVCAFGDEFIRHLASKSLLDNRAALQLAARSEELSDEKVETLAKSVKPLPTPLYGLAVSRFEWSPFRAEIFVDRPGVLTRHVFVQASGDGFAWRDATDIVANEVGVDVFAEDPVAIRIGQGVLDTNAEGLLKTGTLVGNVGEAFATPSRWLALGAKDAARVASLQLPETSRAGIAADLASGHLILAPAEPIEINRNAFAGWWRIDPQTGHTLGMGDNGWGASFAEYAKTFVITALCEFAECSAMHEFVAVARDGAAWGQGAWKGLGACVKRALLAGSLATLWLVVLTVRPGAFFGPKIKPPVPHMPPPPRRPPPPPPKRPPPRPRTNDTIPDPQYADTLPQPKPPTKPQPKAPDTHPDRDPTTQKKPGRDTQPDVEPPTQRRPRQLTPEEARQKLLDAEAADKAAKEKLDKAVHDVIDYKARKVDPDRWTLLGEKPPPFRREEMDRLVENMNRARMEQNITWEELEKAQKAARDANAAARGRQAGIGPFRWPGT